MLQVTPELVRILQEPSIVERPYFFTRLSLEELGEFLAVDPSTHDHYNLSKLAERWYCYQAAQQVEVKITPAVKDLLHLTRWDPHLTTQINHDEINDDDWNHLGRTFRVDQDDPNFDERLMQLLRLGYYLKQ